LPRPAIREPLETPDGVEGRVLSDEPEVLAELSSQWHRLLTTHGAFGVDPAAFRALVLDVLRDRAGPGGAGGGLLVRLALDDLYLAQGCAAGNSRAWRAFDRAFGPTLDRLALLFATTTVSADDARQELLTALFRGRRDGGSAFQTYRGISSLAGWLRVSMRRVVIDIHRNPRWRPVPGGEGPELGLLPDQTPTAEPRLVETQTARAVVAIVRECIAALPEEDRHTLLRYHRDGWILEDIGRECGVHTATVHRRLDRIRGDLGRAVLRLSRERLALQPEEVVSTRDAMTDLFGFVDPTEPGT
jgi:RNA polymerase sigma-70 factor